MAVATTDKYPALVTLLTAKRNKVETTLTAAEADEVLRFIAALIARASRTP